MSKDKRNQPWQKTFNPNYIGAWSFAQGEELFTEITGVDVKTLKNPIGQKEDRVIIFLKDATSLGDNLPMVIGNKENARSLERLSKSRIPADWVGLKICIYVKPDVKSPTGGTTEGLRIKAPASEMELLKKEVKAAFSKYQGADKPEIKAALQKNATSTDKAFFQKILAKLKSE